MGNLVKVNHMEIFRPGTWNGITFKEMHLQEMEENFQVLQGTIRPKLKITHRDDQESLAGLASYGDVVNIFAERIEGELRLFANIEKVPEEVAQWIREGRFQERSIELWLIREIEGVTYRNIVTAISLLGNEIPAVAGLNPVTAKDGRKVIDISDPGTVPQGMAAVNFAFDDKDRLDIQSTNPRKEGGEKMTIEEQLAKMQERITVLENEKKALEIKMKDQAHAQELDTLKAQARAKDEELEQLRSFKANAEKLQTENQELRQKADAAEKERAEHAKKFRVQSVDGIIAKYKKQGKITPAVEAKARELIMSLNDSHPIAKFSEDLEGRTVEVGYSQLRLFESILENLPQTVEFRELGPQGTQDDLDEEEGDTKKSFVHGSETYQVTNDELTARAKRIMERDKCTFEEAVTKASQEFKTKRISH